ncbi:isochorismatase [Heyndrickxia shackletonii]|uniref:Isochorismatase n=1 Tax=Heyndrickxia shackletonii TaxID=157838 RepID=A0A0Q3WX96_9BACI|nr:isochorismatase family protein [Heyndrickxia shackletonii]KQL53892.1 isochorismatase [Heyndrickxia shackletonii]MBB2478946.1 isochorismatase family protein [Bacillus sp. APMAM]NEY97830.1 isochorismatase family protein [Heyndrickxia shackletonii]RTZ57689.1 isochorismatase family protein [Bacillus sp. SAJ1]
MNELNLDFQKTALVLIDLQKGIVSMPGGNTVVDNSIKLIQKFRSSNGFISFVRVAFHDGKDALAPETDHPKNANKIERPADWAELDPRLEVTESDYIVTKRQWGAFFGTDLDIQLRRRGIDTIVLCGIATNIGVESTAREAFQYGYNQIFITDAMTTYSKEEHESSVRFTFPKIGKIRTTEEFLAQVK